MSESNLMLTFDKLLYIATPYSVHTRALSSNASASLPSLLKPPPVQVGAYIISLTSLEFCHSWNFGIRWNEKKSNKTKMTATNN